MNTDDEPRTVNHPQHYAWLRELCGIEPIDICRHLSFNRGNIIKYVLRAGRKTDTAMPDKAKELEDLCKAMWYLHDEIRQLRKETLQWTTTTPTDAGL